jgi:gluconate 2-dehydrogenase gamma chain
MARSSRREFMRRTAMGFGSYLAISSGACKREQPAPAAAPEPTPSGPALPPDGLRALTPDQYRVIAAACERILPRDEDPGATDLGCATYIDRQLAKPEERALFGRPLIGGIEQIDKQAAGRYGHKFADATPEQQDELLGRWQKSSRSGERAFFEVLYTLTLEGAFGDPSYGGNSGGRGFALVGFTPPLPRPGMPMAHAGMR